MYVCIPQILHTQSYECVENLVIIPDTYVNALLIWSYSNFTLSNVSSATVVTVTTAVPDVASEKLKSG